MTTLNVPGPKCKAWIERDHIHLTPSTTRPYPFVMDHGLGAEAWDLDGNRFLDFCAGIAVCATGHSHQHVVRAVQEQAAKFLHMSGTDFYYPVQIELAERLNGVGDFYHFTGDVDATGLRFDYRLKPGITTTRNAITLLKYLGYPPEITENAVDKDT